MYRREKEARVADLHEKFKGVKAAILTDFTGLNVEQINQLRQRLKKSAVEYRVVKNTILRRASEKTDMELLAEYFTGPNAIALAYEDPMEPAKILTEFSKEQPALEVKAGMVEGRVLAPDGIRALASLPSKEFLIANLLALLTVVPTRLLQVLNNPMLSLVCILDGVKGAKEKG
ncbi:MAG: 50S ribosomal protein L10 [Deltaproteobacteria bacterium]|nr:MAG: 50S ribosomal protein L10 [Deltaproteobacteria bacterium]